MASSFSFSNPERRRLLRACEVMGAPALDAFERAVRLARSALEVPVAGIGLLHGETVQYAAATGTECRESPASSSVCRAIVRAEGLWSQTDLQGTDRFAAHPLLREQPALQFGAGLPIVVEAPDHVAAHPTAVGALFVADTSGRRLDSADASLLRDLVAPVKAELERRAAGLRDPAVLEHTSDAYLALDADWHITHLNRRAEALLERDASNLLGTSLWDAFPAAVGTPFERYARGAAEQQETVSFEAYSPPLETWFRGRVVPVDRGVVAYFDDVTEHRERTEFLESINANISEGLFRSSPSEGIVYVNTAFARMFGFERREEVLEVPPSALYAHSEDRKALLQTLESDGTVRGAEIEFERQDGSTFWGLVSCTVVRDDEGRVRYYDGAVMDVTDREQRKKHLRILEQALNSAGEAIMIVETPPSSPPRIGYVNDAFTDVTGYAADDVIGQSPRLLEGPGTDPDVLRPLFNGHGDSTFAAETVTDRADGASRLLQWNLAPIDTDADGPGYWIAVLRNVTERRRIEQELREREQKVEALYAEMGDLLQANRPEDVASHLEDLVIDTLGYSLSAVRFVEDDRLVPTRISDEISSHMPDRPVYPVDGDSVVAEAFRTGETRIYEDIQQIDDAYDRGDARATAYVPIGAHGIISVASLCLDDLDPFDIRLLEILARNAAAVLERIQRETRQRRTIERIDTLRDISQSILSTSSTAALAETTLHRLAAQVPYLRASVVEFDRDEDVARLLAVDDPDASPPTFEDALPLDHFRRPDGTLLRSLRYAESVSGVSSDPVEAHLHAVGIRSYLNAPLHAEGKVIGALNLGAEAPAAYTDEHFDIAREVADMLAVALRQARYRQALVEAKEKAEEMNRLKSAFLANMSHEIRTPLTSIIGFADLLGEYDLGEADQFVQLIEKSGNQLLDTIDSVLDLSKLEAGSVHPSYEPTDVAEEVKDAADLVLPRAKEADLSLHVDVPKARIPAELDQGALQRILQNLLSNAVKFTGPGGSVTVRARQSKESVRLEVEDTGVGIDESFLPSLFNAFEQEASVSGQQGTGTGLGLAVTKRLVDLLDGTIEVASTKGEGTQFTVRLPRFPAS